MKKYYYSEKFLLTTCFLVEKNISLNRTTWLSVGEVVALGGVAIAHRQFLLTI